MATRIRLQRHGKKGKAFFHIVAADSRSKRDGKFIEKLGTYNPNTNPATIEINFDRTLNWVQVGAEMSDTARAILSYKGVLHKNHLLNGVKKGALTAEQVEEKFNSWMDEKENKVTGKKDSLSKTAEADKAARFKAETESKEARAKAIEAKYAPEVEEAPVAEEAPAEEAAANEASSEEAVTAESTEETASADAPAEVKAEETTETAAPEATSEEAPAEETKTEEK